MQCVVLVGGLAAVKQMRKLSEQPEIVIATPGRLWQLIQDVSSQILFHVLMKLNAFHSNNNYYFYQINRIFCIYFQREPHVFRMEGLKFLVIDEVDRMMEQNHFVELEQILNHVHQKW